MAKLVKLLPPSADAVIARPRLFRAVDRERTLVWISGPAGAGKTTLASTYLRARRLAAVWYTLDAADADPATLFHYLARALPRARLPALTSDVRADLPVFVRRFFDAFAARLPPRAALVFDDHHEVGGALDGVLRLAVGSLRAGQRLVVVSRLPPPAELAHLEASGALLHVNEEQLRLTLAEAGAIARKRRKRVAPRLLRDIHDRTAGWVAGLVLFLERGGADALATPALVHDLLATQHLDAMPRETYALLLRIAVPVRVSVRMAAELGGPRAPAALTALARRGAFVSRVGTRFEIHPLLREVLLERGRAELDDETIAELRRTAARACAAEGDADEAVDLFASVGEWPALVALAAERAPALVAEGREATLTRWLSRVPAEHRDGDPQVLFWLGQTRAFTHPGAGHADIARAFDIFRRRGDRAGQLAAWPAAVGTLFAASENLAGVDAWMALIDELAPDRAELPPLLVSLLGVLTIRMPHHPRAQEWADHALQLVADDAGDTCAMLGTYLVERAFFLGDSATARVVREALRRARPVSLRGKIAAHHASSLAALLDADVGGCLTAVDAGLALAASVAPLQGLLLHAIGARAYLVAGDPRGANEHLVAMAEGPMHVARLCVPHHAMLDAWRALAVDDVELALVQARLAARLTNEIGAPLPEAQTRLVLAQVLIELGRRDEAVAELGRVRAIAAVTRSRALDAHAHLCEAQLAGSREVAAAHLGAGLAAGVGLVATWAAKPATIARLCELALDSDVEVGTAVALVRLRAPGHALPPAFLEAWPWPVKVRLCGGFTLDVPAKRVPIRGKAQKRPLELLQILVALGGRDVPAHILCDLLWPAADGDRASRALEVTLHRLRSLLGDGSLVRRSQHLISLDRSRIFADVWAIEELVRKAPRDPAAAQRARTLVGEGVLPASAEPWAAQTRARIDALLATVGP